MLIKIFNTEWINPDAITYIRNGCIVFNGGSPSDLMVKYFIPNGEVETETLPNGQIISTPQGVYHCPTADEIAREIIARLEERK